MGFGTNCSELEVLVSGQFGDDRGEEGDHPQLAEEDEGEDSENEDCGGEDTFHAGLNRIYPAAGRVFDIYLDLSRYIVIAS